MPALYGVCGNEQHPRCAASEEDGHEVDRKLRLVANQMQQLVDELPNPKVRFTTSSVMLSRRLLVRTQTTDLQSTR